MAGSVQTQHPSLAESGATYDTAREIPTLKSAIPVYSRTLEEALSVV
jgi:hypothetical protein